MPAGRRDSQIAPAGMVRGNCILQYRPTPCMSPLGATCGIVRWPMLAGQIAAMYGPMDGQQALL